MSTSPERPTREAPTILETDSPSATETLGARLGHACEGGEVIALIGVLGAGKTCLVRGLARGLSALEQRVTSPSFALIHEYAGRAPIVHVDLYRLDAADAVNGLGLEEYLESPAVTVIEWAEKVSALLPRDHLRIELEHLGGDRRRILLHPLSDRYERLVRDAVAERDPTLP